VKLSVIALTKKYERVLALDQATFEAPDSRITVLLGPSGSGKSTALRLIAGLERPDSGVILFDDEPVNLPPEKRGVSMVFQSFSLFPHMSVKQNILFGVRSKNLLQAQKEAIAKEIAELVGVADKLDAKPDELSGGQQQRVALARALASTPRLLLLDEPFSNLDARLREELRWELKRIQAERGITMVHVTHDYTEALALADHIVVLNQGKVEQEGEAEWLIENPKNEFVAWFLGYNVVKINGERVWFRPHKARLSQDGELCGLVELVQNAYFGKKVRVKGNGWSVEVLEQGDVPKLGSTVCVKLLEMRHFANWEKL
jgi:ABC-type sugar transport system ATPase subunit